MSKSVESSNPRVESPNVLLNAPKNSKPNSHVGNANDPKTVMTQQLLTLGTVRSPGTKASTVQEQSASSEPDVPTSSANHKLLSQPTDPNKVAFAVPLAAGTAAAAIIVIAFLAWEASPSFTDPSKTQFEAQREITARAASELQELFGRLGTPLSQSKEQLQEQIDTLFRDVQSAGGDIRKSAEDFVSGMSGSVRSTPPSIPAAPDPASVTKRVVVAPTATAAGSPQTIESAPAAQLPAPRAATPAQKPWAASADQNLAFKQLSATRVEVAREVEKLNKTLGTHLPTRLDDNLKTLRAAELDLQTAIGKYGKARAAAANTGLSLDDNRNGFNTTLNTAHRLLGKVDSRRQQLHQLDASEQASERANPLKLSGMKYDRSAASATDILRYLPTETALRTVGGVTGLVRAGVITKPQDLLLLKPLTLVPAGIPLLSKSLEHFVQDAARNGQPDSKGLVAASQFLLDDLKAKTNSAVYSFPSAEALSTAAKPLESSNSGRHIRQSVQVPRGNQRTREGDFGPPDPPKNKLVGAPKEVLEIGAQLVVNVAEAAIAGAHSAWPHVRTGAAVTEPYGEILSFLKNPKTYLGQNYNNVGPVHFPTTVNGQILWDSKHNVLMARIPSDLYKSAVAEADKNGWRNTKSPSGYWYDNKSRELMVNVVVRDKTIGIALRPPASEDPKSGNTAEFLTPKPSKVNDPTGRGIPFLPGGELTLLNLQVGPSDGFHWKFNAGIDLTGGTTPKRTELFVGADPSRSGFAVYRQFRNTNQATAYGIGKIAVGDPRYISAQNPKDDVQKSLQTIFVAQLVFRDTQFQIAAGTSPKNKPGNLSVEVSTKRASVFELDVGMRFQAIGFDGRTREVFVLDEWAAANVTYYKVKLSGSTQQLKNLPALKPGDVLRLEGFKVAANQSKASVLSGTFTVATVEAPSVSNDGSSYVVIYREQDPSDNAAENPLPLPPQLRIDSDANGNPILAPWQPQRGPRPPAP